MTASVDEPIEASDGKVTPTAIYWNRQYYDNMAFHFWEPQHIGRTRHPETRIRSEAEAVAKLRTLEVVLNHQMELFFRLAPNDLVQRLFAGALGEGFQDGYRIIGREFEAAFAVNGLTQPDLLFEGRQCLVAFELKLGAKTSLEQVIKYAGLFSLVPPQRQAYGLLFMGPKGFRELWREKYGSAAEVQAALSALDHNSLRPKLRQFMEENGAAVRALLGELRIGFMSYSELHDRLARELAMGGHHETYARLLAGMVAELEERGLAKPIA